MFVRTSIAVWAALFLIGCGPKEAAEVPKEVAPGVAPVAPVDVVPALTADGWGPVRTGMTHEAATAALDGEVKADPSTRNADWTACHMIQPQAPEGVWIMVENDKVTRVSLEGGPVVTDKGIKVGDPEERVREAYPAGLAETPHKYRDAPAKYLTWYARPAEAGLRYSIGEDGRVHAIAGGGKSIEYVEGCA